MRVLVACEYSGVVREAFKRRGHYAMSCDLLPTDIPGEHYQGDMFDIIDKGWDLMIGHPPCTDLCVSGSKYFAQKIADGRQQRSIDFFMRCMNAPIDKICVENPVGIMSSKFRKPDQIIQPWQFGHPESKATCLWLKNLPKLIPTQILPKPINGRWDNQTPSGQNKLGPSKDRAKIRSKTYEGIAEAFAAQWG
jgi:hypothetical protein